MDKMDYNDIERLERGTKGTLPLRSKILFILAVSGMGFVFSMSPTSIVGILCIACAAGGFAYLFRVQKMHSVVVTAVISGILGMLYSGGDINTAILSLAFVVPAAAIILARRYKAGRADAAMGGAVLLGIFAALYFLVNLYISNGALNGDVVSSYIDGMFSLVKDEFVLLGLDETNAELFVSYFKVLSPSVVGVMLLSASYLSGSCYGFFCRATGAEEEVSDWKLQLSAVSAVVYILLFSAVAILSCVDQNALFYGLTNAEVILTPGFIIIGFRAYKSFLRERRESGKSNLLPIIITVLLLVCNVYGLAGMLAFIGAVDIILKELKKLSEKNSDRT